MVDPELLPLLDSFPEIAMSEHELPKLRAAIGSQTLPAGSGTPGVTIDQHFFPSEDGGPDIRVLEFRPAAKQPRSPAILYIHGGGFVLGTPEMAAAAGIHLAHALNCVVFSVDYRLAPETPYPGALHDCYTAFKNIYGRAALLGIDECRIALFGESAGGGLAASLSLFARDNSGPSPCFQLLVAPMLDDRTGRGVETNDFAGNFIWTRESNRYAWQSFLGDLAENDEIPYYAAPARCGNLKDLPPTFICTGALDLFVDESITFVHRLISTGIPTEFHVYPGAFHGFQMSSSADVSKKAESDWIRAFGKIFSRLPSSG